MNKQQTSGGLRDAACSPSSGLRTISGNPSMLRNADVGHMLELREKLATAERERDDAVKDAEKARAYKKVLKNENARLRRMLNLQENSKDSLPELGEFP